MLRSSAVPSGTATSHGIVMSPRLLCRTPTCLPVFRRVQAAPTAFELSERLRTELCMPDLRRPQPRWGVCWGLSTNYTVAGPMAVAVQGLTFRCLS